MAKTYKAFVNELLVELNEPEVSTVATGVGIQKQDSFTRRDLSHGVPAMLDPIPGTVCLMSIAVSA